MKEQIEISVSSHIREQIKYLRKWFLCLSIVEDAGIYSSFDDYVDACIELLDQIHRRKKNFTIGSDKVKNTIKLVFADQYVHGTNIICYKNIKKYIEEAVIFYGQFNYKVNINLSSYSIKSLKRIAKETNKKAEELIIAAIMLGSKVIKFSAPDNKDTFLFFCNKIYYNYDAAIDCYDYKEWIDLRIRTFGKKGIDGIVESKEKLDDFSTYFPEISRKKWEINSSVVFIKFLTKNSNFIKTMKTKIIDLNQKELEPKKQKGSESKNEKTYFYEDEDGYPCFTSLR